MPSPHGSIFALWMVYGAPSHPRRLVTARPSLYRDRVKDRPDQHRPRRVLVLGATGTIGRETVRTLVAHGHDVVCFVRPGTSIFTRKAAREGNAGALTGADIRFGAVTDPRSLLRDGLRGERFDVLLSCLASRTGTPADAWAIDHDAHVGALEVARASGIPHLILLSAICVQRPVLAFQHAKRAFEKLLVQSGIDYTIVRPTAFFKSLSGQVDRVKRGKPYLVFGDGTLTACKPIGDRDLATYLAECIDNPNRRNRILPIGGPGEPITPRMQGEALFALLGQPPRFRRVPVALLDGIAATFAIMGRMTASLAAKAELARIGRYYATESMLVLDPATGLYDANATPSFGSETLFDHYARLIAGEVVADRGDHAVF